MRTISTETEFKNLRDKKQLLLVYFSTLSCSVGEALEPKVEDLVARRFPKIELIFVDMNALPTVSADNQVFVEPTLLLFVDGKESMRKSRHLSLIELEEHLNRIDQLLFGESTKLP